MRSDSTRVPPVTPERSPPASRMTGADSPVMADSSTDATPSMISPSPGMICPADHDHDGRRPAGRSETVSSTSTPDRRCQAGYAGVVLARLAQGVGLGLAARLGQRLGEVGEQDGQEQPDVERDQVAERCVARAVARSAMAIV